MYWSEEKRTNENDMLSSRIEFGNISLGVTMGIEEEGFSEVFQANEDRFRHTLFLGRTGSPKTGWTMWCCSTRRTSATCRA